MISYLRGQIRQKIINPKKDSWVVLDVSGVGYKVYLNEKATNELVVNQEIELHIYTQVAETALDLYGFTTQEELSFFEMLISISGVGPKSALNILQKAKIEDLKKAAQTGSAEILNKVSGIGPKTAQKIVAGLQNKLGSIDEIGASDWNAGFGDALEALVGLGYSAGQAREALAKCKSEDVGDKVKEALGILGGKR